MFEVKNLTISIMDRYLVNNLSFILNNGDKLAIIGEEGNGKSTLLKVLLGIANYVNFSGSINRKGHSIGYLEQSMSEEHLSKKVFDYLFMDKNDYFEKISNLYVNLDKLNISEEILNQMINTLSGGEKVKIGILKILLEDNDILFLDEPTNDLDIETLEWLENFINSINKPIIFVSHDETLLSKTANCILHLEQIKKKSESRSTFIRVDYDTYVNDRIRKIDKQTQVAKSEKREFNKQKEKYMQIMQRVEHEQNVISRGDPFHAAALKVKMRSLKSQERRMNNKELTEVPDVEEGINFFFEDSLIPRNKQILNLKLPKLKVDNKILSENIELNIIGNSHMCIIGKNGCGKTTLIKYIYSILKDRKDIKVGYMPQKYDDILNLNDNVIDFICESKDKESITKARMYLGNMKFTHEEMEGKIKDLSNGTKAKLFLIKLVLDECNVLILDEPTRNVSPLSNPVIRKVLRNFNGAIISISHDRKYIDEVIDELYLLTKNGLKKEH